MTNEVVHLHLVVVIEILIYIAIHFVGPIRGEGVPDISSCHLLFVEISSKELGEDLESVFILFDGCQSGLDLFVCHVSGF